MNDIHLMGRQNEGIEGIDPVRHGRVATGEQVDSKGRNSEKKHRSIRVTHVHPDIHRNVYVVQRTHRNQCEKLRYI